MALTGEEGAPEGGDPNGPGRRSEERGPGRVRQAEVFVRGVGGRRPRIPAAPEELERRAEKAMTREAWAYMRGGAGGETTIRANREAFDRARIVPRVLRDVSARDLSVELLGRRLPAPLLLAPIGVLEMAHRGADREVARAAAAEGVPFVFSNQASHSMEACAEAMGGGPRWFQLYWSRSPELVESFLQRAEACGCEALVLTLDTTLLGWRPRDLDLAYLPFLRGKGLAQYLSDPVFRRLLVESSPDGPAEKPPMGISSLRALVEMVRKHPQGAWYGLRSGEARKAVQRFIATYSRPSLAWEDLDWLRRRTSLPLLLKGILHPDDARMAMDHGVDGLIVSNHGGRQVDGAVGSLDALPGVVEATGDRLPILFDSGIRTGADVFKALALGARAVLLGRPYAYALALAGEEGVREVIRNVVAELDLTLGLTGCRNLREVRETRLARPGNA